MKEILQDFSRIPERIAGLGELAYNLWWSWHPGAWQLFQQIDRTAWRESGNNPVRMLTEVPQVYLERAAGNAEYLRRYDIVMNRFHQYMTSKTSWFTEHYQERKPLTIAFFSPEYGLHHSLPFYAGGLGILAGDLLKESSDLGVPMVAVGFMYAEGYLHQHLDANGWQKNITELLNRATAPVVRVLDDNGEQLVVQIPYMDPPIYVAIWKVQVGRIPLYLMDTGIPMNEPSVRGISHRLYLKDQEQRLRQGIVLGIGGRKVLATLGIKYSAIHLNEGHSAFALLERVREKVERGLPFEQALRQVQETSIFTTHTPVPAAHDIHPHWLMEKYFGDYYRYLGLDWEGFLNLGACTMEHGDGFDVTAMAMRLTRFHNAVSRRHGEVARRMWQALWPALLEDEIPIDHITNGVHLGTWLNDRMASLFSRYIDQIAPNWHQIHDDPAVWEVVVEIPDQELWETHRSLKMDLFNRIRERKRRSWMEHRDEPHNLIAAGLLLDPNVLTIGFARRLCDYKRADLIFHDLDRLERIVTDRWRPVQIIFAGKAHPADELGKQILQRIYQYAQRPEFAGRIAFVEDYGEQLAHCLVQGVDVWLNNPIPQMEASGTSGMKAGMNGVLNLSILDGWWVEGYNGRNGWAFEGSPSAWERDAEDAAAIYSLLEREVIPLYYATGLDGIPHGWVRMMKESIKSIAPRYSARRMVKEYIAKYYPSVRMYAGRHIEEGFVEEAEEAVPS